MRAVLVLLTCAGCAGSVTDDVDSDDAYLAEVWADNWFAMYVDGEMVGEDSVPITTERSFNAETFSFDATPPFVLAAVVKDFKENDTGLEYIGEGNQQMGDGGFVAQLWLDDAIAAVTNADWRCLVTHIAPTNPDCEDDADPNATCLSETVDEPDGWMTSDFDDSAWPAATEYTAAQVDPKDGYDEVSWDDLAKLIWTSDLETHNTLLCRFPVP
jgi:hypothetical protein